MKKARNKEAVKIFLKEAENLSFWIKVLLVFEVVLFLVFVPISLLLILV